MLKLAALAGFLAMMPGCVSVADVRAKPVAYQGTSQKPQNTIAACVSTALQVGHGVLVNTVPLENGISIIQSAHVPQGITPFIIVDLQTDAGMTTMTVKANGRTPRDPSKNFRSLIQCL
jgi:hypothetical protein